MSDEYWTFLILLSLKVIKSIIGGSRINTYLVHFQLVLQGSNQILKTREIEKYLFIVTNP